MNRKPEHAAARLEQRADSFWYGGSKSTPRLSKRNLAARKRMRELL